MSLNDFIGVPYLLGGRDPAVGLDCYGLVACVAAQEGKLLPFAEPPDPTIQKTKILRRMREVRTAYAVQIPTPTDGCVAYDERRGHIGVYHSGRVVHAAREHGVISVRLDDWLAVYQDTEYFEWRTLS